MRRVAHAWHAKYKCGCMRTYRHTYRTYTVYIHIHHAYTCIPGWTRTCKNKCNPSRFHQFFHLLRSAYLRVACGVPTNPLHSELAGKELGPQNVPILSCPIRTSLAADAFALNKLREYRQGSIVQWAWMTTGHVSEEEVAEWKFNKDLDALKEAMAACKGGIKELLHMTEVPPVNTEVLGVQTDYDQSGYVKEIR